MPQNKHPFYFVLKATLAASSQGTASYNVAKQERIEVHKVLTKATGAFQINDIRDSQGKHFTNASSNEPIPDTFMGKSTDAYNNLGEFPIPLMVDGGVTLYFDLEDTSAAANTVYLICSGTREYL